MGRNEVVCNKCGGLGIDKYHKKCGKCRGIGFILGRCIKKETTILNNNYNNRFIPNNK
jgi:hypothetical protein